MTMRFPEYAGMGVGMFHSRGAARVVGALALAVLIPTVSGCFTSPTPPARPSAVEVPLLPRSPTADMQAAGNHRAITCPAIEGERAETAALMQKLQQARWDLICRKPTPKKPLEKDQIGGAIFECLAYLPVCAALGIAVAIEYEAKKPACPDPAGRAAKDAALGERLDALSARLGTLRALAESKNCAAEARPPTRAATRTTSPP